MADDIDIKEHDILLNPRMRDYLFALNIKTEPIDYEDKYKLQTDGTNDYFVEGNMQLIKTDPVNQVVQKPKDVCVCLEDCAHWLNSSSCYCKECAILFTNRNALDIHKMAAHSLLVAIKTVLLEAPIKTENPYQQGVPAPKKGNLGNHSSNEVAWRQSQSKEIQDNNTDRVTGLEKRKCKYYKESISQKRCLTEHNMKQQHSREKLYQCDYCGKSFARKILLKLHIRTHTGERSYQCNVCPKVFKQNNILKRHIMTHTGKKPHKCNVCQKTFFRKYVLKTHIMTRTAEKPYQCNICQKSFSQKMNPGLDPEDQVVQKPKEVRVCLEDCAHGLNSSPCYCKECAILFANRNALDIHKIAAHSPLVAVKTVLIEAPIKTKSPYQQGVPAPKKGKLGDHSSNEVAWRQSQSKEIQDNITDRVTGLKKRKCKYYKESFSQKRCLTEHNMKQQHSRKKLYQCDYCGKSFARKILLKLHIRTHTGRKRHQCNVCQKTFSRKYVLKTHIMTHTAEKPYQCNICQKSFSQKINFKVHIRTHTGEKPYKCNFCQKTFSQGGHLRYHIMIHTKEKPHKCNVCQKSFSRKSHLIVHSRSHTGEKPHQCETCLKYFTYHSQLHSHKKQHARE